MVNLILLISAPNENIVRRSESMSLFGLDLSSVRIFPAVNSGPFYA